MVNLKSCQNDLVEVNRVLVIHDFLVAVQFFDAQPKWISDVEVGAILQGSDLEHGHS